MNNAWPPSSDVRSSIRRKKRRPDDSMSFMDFGAEDRDVVYERLIIPDRTTYRRRTIAEFKAELNQSLVEATKTGEEAPA